MRFYEVVVGSDSGPQRRLRVASPTDVGPPTPPRP